MKTKFLIGSSVLLLLAIFFPSNNLWSGDGYTIKEFVKLPWDQIIATKDAAFFIHPIPILLTKYLGFWWTSLLCGLVYLFYSLKLAEKNSNYYILLCLPIVQVFLGYTEMYAPFYATAVMCLYYYLNWKFDKAIYLLPLVVFSHFVMAIPIACLIGWNYIHRDLSKYERNPSIWEFSTIALLLTYCFYALYICIDGARPSVILPLTGYYSLFSIEHLKDILWLLALYCIWIIGTKPKKNFVGLNFKIPAAVSLTMVFMLSSHIGMVRDWDLFGFFIIPLVFYISEEFKINILSYIITGVLTIIFIVFNHWPSQERMFQVMWEAPQYDNRFLDGKLLWNTASIYEDLGDMERRNRLLERYFEDETHVLRLRNNGR